MNSARELANYLKTLDSGAAMSDLIRAFPDDSISLKQCIKYGLENGMIIKDGEKRGTRYYVAEKFVPKEKPKEIEDNTTLEHYDLDAYLNSNVPIRGQAVITNLTKFGRNEESLYNFLNSGTCLESIYIQYDKIAKKNIITEKLTRIQYNKIKISFHNDMFIFTKHNVQTGKTEEESFRLYEDLREYLRSLL